MGQPEFLAPPRRLDAPLRLDPASWSPRDVYRLHTALVVPRPIAWVSTRSAEGVDNLAPHSYFNGVADDPPMVMFSIEGKTDTWWNLQEVPEFVVSFVAGALAEAMEISAVRMPPDEDEFAWAGLEKRTADCVRPARVAESLAALECVVESVTPVGRRNQMVIGRVVRYHVSEAVWREGRVDPSRYRPVGRLAGHYCEQGRRFRMRRPEFAALREHGAMGAARLTERTPLPDPGPTE